MNALVLILAPLRVLTLADALHTATVNQPTLRQARAGTQAASARADEARSGLLPQITGNATYQRTTANFTPQPGLLPSKTNASASTSSIDTSNYWAFSLQLNQLIYDFGQTGQHWRSVQSLADAQQATERSTALTVEATVRTGYFAARAQKALVEVAKETLDNLNKHLDQIQGFVTVGTHPEIDLAQAKTDCANARFALIQAQNNYETAKAQLNLAIGVEGSTDYDVNDETLPPVDGEDEGTDGLVGEAVRARPDLASLNAQVRSQGRRCWRPRAGTARRWDCSRRSTIAAPSSTRWRGTGTRASRRAGRCFRGCSPGRR